MGQGLKRARAAALATTQIEQWMVDAAKELRQQIHSLNGPPGSGTNKNDFANAIWLDQVSRNDAYVICKHYMLSGRSDKA